MSARVIVFGGTGEGRMLAAGLAGAGIEVLLLTATGYGEELAGQREHMLVQTGRLDADGMAHVIAAHPGAPVVDATHPFAREATVNIRAACEARGARYLRVKRGSLEEGGDVVFADSMEDAARVLAADGSTALLTVGSKELAAFTSVPGYREKLFVRVLPAVESLRTCGELGFPGKQIICMQGPFTVDLNAAMLRQLGASWLVTKDSGEAGGVPEKLAAARKAGARALVVRRPVEESGGAEWRDILHLLLGEFGVKNRTEESAAGDAVPRLPLFVDLKDQPVLVVGGGAVAARRVNTLLRCGARVTVIALKATQELLALAVQGRIRFLAQAYKPGDIGALGAALVVAATDDVGVNDAVAGEADALQVPCSAAHDRNKGSFWFPAFVWEGSLVAGIVSTDADHKAVREAAEDLRKEWKKR